MRNIECFRQVCAARTDRAYLELIVAFKTWAKAGDISYITISLGRFSLKVSYRSAEEKIQKLRVFEMTVAILARLRCRRNQCQLAR